MDTLTKNDTPKHYLSWPAFLVIALVLFVVLYFYQYWYST